MIINLLFISLFFLFVNSKTHKQAKYPFIEYCRYFNYPVEQHKIETTDGYILTYYRIQKKYSIIKQGLQPILLHHGLFDSSDTWIVNSQQLAPAFVFANQGYDIWVGNSRGNKYSNQHVKYNPQKDPIYWQFTFQHMAEFDLPAAFKYISSKTRKKINYIGHSQGTVIMHIAMTQQIKDVTDNLDKYFAYGPVAYVGNQKSNFFSFILKTNFLEFLKNHNINSFFDKTNWIETQIGLQFCSLFQYVCADLLKYVMDADPREDNYERYDVIVGHAPSGTSTLNLIHWKQLYETNKFQKYDYGQQQNMIIYGQSTPPQFNLSMINQDIRLFVGSQDLLADQIDVDRLWDEIPQQFKKFKQVYKAGHCTFMWGITINPWTNDLLNMMKEGEMKSQI